MLAGRMLAPAHDWHCKRQPSTRPDQRTVTVTVPDIITRVILVPFSAKLQTQVG